MGYESWNNSLLVDNLSNNYQQSRDLMGSHHAVNTRGPKENVIELFRAIKINVNLICVLFNFLFYTIIALDFFFFFYNFTEKHD